MQKGLIAEKIVVECDIAWLNYALFAQSNRLTIQSNLYWHHAPSIVFPVVDWISVYIEVDMGERRKTLNIWLKRMWDKDGVKGIRPEAKDTKNIRGQRQSFRGETLSRARTQAQVFSKKYKYNIFKNLFHAFNKKIFKSFFQVISKKQNQKISKKQIILQKKNDLQKILRIPKILMSSSWGQGNFRGLEASRPRTSKCVLEDSISVNGM